MTDMISVMWFDTEADHMSERCNFKTEADARTYAQSLARYPQHINVTLRATYTEGNITHTRWSELFGKSAEEDLRDRAALAEERMNTLEPVVDQLAAALDVINEARLSFDRFMNRGQAITADWIESLFRSIDAELRDIPAKFSR